jgi:hypothetical protein
VSQFLQPILQPELYHGNRKRPPFFEGWYYKVVDAAENHIYAIIPGVFLSDDPNQAHAFVQVFDGKSGRNTFHRYPMSAFWSARNSFEIRIGTNRFTTEEISLQIDVPERTVQGELRFLDLTPWPVSLRSPGIMGWYAWVPFMECYHGVLSMDHTIEGRLKIDSQPIDFSAGRGYIEKDWGKSFPSAWVWLQSNHFEQPGTSLTASVAVIPWLRGSFPGFIVGLWHNGTLYRFATYTGARIEHLEIEQDHVNWTLRNRHHRLEIHALRAEGTLLAGPTTSDMGLRVPETLQAVVKVRLVEIAGQQVLFQGQGRHAGLEVAGKLEELSRMTGR